MITKQLHELHPWEKNARHIGRVELDNLKRDITELGQYKPLLITADGTIIAGNMRYRAMQELGITEIKCAMVEFVKEEEGYMAVIDGEPQRTKFYKTIEDAMMRYSLSDNSQRGYYDAEEFMKIMPEFDLDYTKENVSFFRPLDITQSMTKLVAPDLFDNKNYNIVIEAVSEEDQKMITERLKSEGYKVKEKRKK